MDKELQQKIFKQVQDEREYQEVCWADAENTHEDWQEYCAEYALANTERTAGRNFRERMVKVAALAFAAIEAVDEGALADK